MKKRANWLIIPAVAFGLGACSKKEESKNPVAVAETPANPTPTAPVIPKVPTVTPEQRAATVGFAKYLPQDTEAEISYYNGSKISKKVKASKLWKTVTVQMSGGIVDPEDSQAEAKVKDAADEPVGAANLFGTEFTMAMGKSTSEQTGNLLAFSRRMNYFQFRGIAQALVAAAKTGTPGSFEKAFGQGYNQDLFTELLKDPKSGVNLIEKLKMPPLYFAFRTSEAQRPAALQQVSALLANLSIFGDKVAAVDTEKSGHKFGGFKVLGEKISADMAKSRESLDKSIGTELTDQLIASMAKKDMVILSGTIGDYVVLFFGSSVDDLNFAPDAEHSLCGTDALAFSDAYAKKDLAALVYGQKASMETLQSAVGGISDMTAGLRDGLSGSEGLGDTRDLEAMLQIVAERESALRKLMSNNSLGTIAHFEDGLKIETFGGSDSGAVDWKAANKLAPLGDSPDVVFFANMTVDESYKEKAHAYFDSLLETVYAMAMKVTEVQSDSQEMTKYKQMAKMFDSKFRPDAVTLWDAFSGDFSKSLGNESALVVDLKGAAPAIPGVSQAVVDQAKVPRISWIRPVKNRAELAASWDKMNTSATAVLAKISEMSGQKIPMQKPISSEKNGLTTWFFPLPFFNDDFLPSVTVGDQWFAASTSKNQAVDLIGKAKLGGKTRDGFWLKMNFKALQSYAEATYKIVDENAKSVSQRGLSEKEKKDAHAMIQALGDLDSLTIHSHREGQLLRTSIYFKTRLPEAY
jgi:hypothetical protein